MILNDSFAAERSNVGAAFSRDKTFADLIAAEAAPTFISAAIGVVMAVVVLGVARADTSQSTPPREDIARYHVTVTVQKNEDTGTGVAWQPAARDLRTGSGTIVDQRGIVVTAAHIVRSARRGVVVRAYDGSTYRARVLHVDADSELAVLKAKRAWDFEVEAPPVNGSPRAGDRVTGVGLPSSLSVAARPGHVHTPRDSGQFRFGQFGFRDPIVLTMNAGPGFSGGPVFDGQDRWVGMIVGYALTRNDDGDVVHTGTTYVLPAGRVMDVVHSTL